MVKGQGHESQKQRRRGSLHYCECWLFYFKCLSTGRGFEYMNLSIFDITIFFSDNFGAVPGRNGAAKYATERRQQPTESLVGSRRHWRMALHVQREMVGTGERHVADSADVRFVARVLTVVAT